MFWGIWCSMWLSECFYYFCLKLKATDVTPVKNAAMNVYDEMTYRIYEKICSICTC